MPQLSDVLTAPGKKAAVVDDCLTIIDAEVSDKSGFSGLAIKAGFSAIKSVKPGFIKQAVEDLLPEFAVALDPVFQDALTQAAPLAEFFVKNSTRVADALLSITELAVLQSWANRSSPLCNWMGSVGSTTPRRR